MAAGAGRLEFDRIGYWSEVKLDIVREYAKANSTILAKQKPKFEHFYIDGFAGAGEHVSKTTGQPVPGSPLNALNVTPPFKKYHFVDLEQRKVEHLR
jgi:three-Cys-motif partner protein